MAIYLSADLIEYTDNSVTPAVTTTAQAFTYGPNVSDYGAPYQNAYARLQGSTVELGGEIKSAVALSAGAVLLDMSIDLTPKSDEQSFIIVNGVMVTVNIQAADGKIVIANGTIAAGAKVSLNTVVYLHRDAFLEVTPLIEPDVENKIIFESIDEATNIIKTVITEENKLILRYEQAGADVKELIISPDGIDVQGNNWTGITFANKLLEIDMWGNVGIPQELTLSKGTPYGGMYTLPAYYKQMGRVYLQGLAKGPYVAGDVIATLPVNFRPALLVSFECATTAGPGVRVDVAADGKITVQGACPFVYLDNIQFYVGSVA